MDDNKALLTLLAELWRSLAAATARITELEIQLSKVVTIDDELQHNEDGVK